MTFYSRAIKMPLTIEIFSYHVRNLFIQLQHLLLLVELAWQRVVCFVFSQQFVAVSNIITTYIYIPSHLKLFTLYHALVSGNTTVYTSTSTSGIAPTSEVIQGMYLYLYAYTVHSQLVIFVFHQYIDTIHQFIT